jgi:hypothetical protein
MKNVLINVARSAMALVIALSLATLGDSVSEAVTDVSVAPNKSNEVPNEKLSAIADRIQDKFGGDSLANESENLKTPDKEGFISVSVDAAASNVRLFWAGKPDAGVQEYLDSEGSVSVEQGEYSYEYMHTVGISLIEDLPNISALKGLVFSLLRPHVDGSGVDLEMTRNGEATSTVDAFEVQNSLSSTYDLSISLSIEDEGLTLLSSRQTDVSPYSGGSGYETTNVPYCSTGFGVKKSTTNLEYLLTAYHCFDGFGSNQSVFKPGTSSVWGSWSQTSGMYSGSRDAALIRPSSGNASGYVYVGPFDTSTKELIYGSATNTIGMSACIDGANSGYRCGVEVTNLGILKSINGSLVTLIEGDATGIFGAVEGDSGGPVLKIGYIGTTRVFYGLGIISGGLRATNCPISSYTNQITCYGLVYWPSLQTTLNSLGLVLAN